MIKILLDSLSFILSFSIRSPCIDTLPYDYEWRVGMRSEILMAEYLYERENGMYYRGHEVAGYYKGGYIKDFYREAQKISSQSAQFILPISENGGILNNILFGGGITLKEWKNLKWVLSFGVKNSWLETLYSTNFNDRHIHSLATSFILPLTDKIAVQPKFIYNFVDGKSSYHGKIYLVYRF